MTAVTVKRLATPGTPRHNDAPGAVAASSQQMIDEALRDLVAKRKDWARLAVAGRRAVLGELIKDFPKVAERWAEACRQAEGLPADSPAAGEEWLAGPYMVLRNLNLLAGALDDIERHGQPRIPGPVKTLPDGRVAAQVFPQTAYDRIFYGGFTAEVWMQPGVTREGLAATQAAAYRKFNPEGAVTLVLGAGNVSSIGAMDVLYKVFVENHVVVLKMHPLNAYLGPLIAESFQALLDWGALRIVYGGAEVGAYLTSHPDVDDIHITGSDKTVEAMVFGTGPEGKARKAKRRPKLEKPISSELGNVSAVIVVPGEWSKSDVDYHAENLVSMLTNNAGFNCNATRVIVQHQSWPQRGELLDGFRRHLDRVAPRKAYYPGAEDRHAAFVAAHPEAEQFGAVAQGELPWTLIADVDPAADNEICFRTEAFCGVTSETGLVADSVADYVARAVEFVNEKLWGTLNATLLVHPKSLADPEIERAVERAIADLRHGTVTINCWAAVGYGLVITPWGGYPGHDVYDVQSGSGFVHNTLMFDKAEKAVVRAPFRVSPKPMWFPSHKTAHEMAKKLTEFEAAPSAMKLPGIFWEALRG